MKVISRKRGKKVFSANSIGTDRWKKYFMELLEGDMEDSRKWEVINENY